MGAHLKKYNQERDNETIEREGLISGAAITEGPSKPRCVHACRHWLLSFVVAQSLIIIALIVYITLHWKPSDLACATQLSPYSPYLESGDLEHEEFTEENHLMQPSPYRGHPTPEVEEAWLKLWRLPTIHFPEERMVALNKTPAQNYAHVSAEYGGGMLGFLNVFHQLHCLNLVRQYTYRDEYDFSNVTAFRAPNELVRGHVDHCIETIRKSLMCTSDVTPVVFIKDPSRASGGKSDFNLRRKCRNFQRIQEWAIENRASS
ncbi:Tat pathway signal sequence [Pleurostoma richardsiae]|uniref:Tat pathway signal sequence n=1 Tax=Pleurostoma richardsiae TaxID=41990 RepID=A0AA38RVT2_9PEZI|nr:Tat pathway signal sequence [Pleurostoma richardsiae]